MRNDLRLPITASVEALVDAIEDVQRRSRTRLAEPIELAQRAASVAAIVGSVAVWLQTEPEKLGPSADLWCKKTRVGDVGDVTLLSLSASGWWVRRCSHPAGTYNGALRLHMIEGVVRARPVEWIAQCGGSRGARFVGCGWSVPMPLGLAGPMPGARGGPPMDCPRCGGVVGGARIPADGMEGGTRC